MLEVRWFIDDCHIYMYYSVKEVMGISTLCQ